MTTRAVAEDLRAHLLNGRVDKIVQPAEFDVALLLRAEFANQWLVLSAHAQQARVQRTLTKQSGAFSEPSPFVMLLRKHLEGARLHAIGQQGVDRVLHLSFHGASGETTLIAEVMGKYSNVILSDREGIVLGAIKLIRAEENRFRVVLPRHPYLTPPRPMRPAPHQDQPKLDPASTRGGDIAAALAQIDREAPLWKSLLDVVDGLSPTLAREVTFLAAGAVDAPLGDHRDLTAATRLLTLIRERFAMERGQPSAIWRGPKLAEWAAFPLRQFGEEPRLYPDIATLLDAAYAERRTGDALASQRGPLMAAIETQRKNLRRKIASLQASITDQAELAALRRRGEMVLAYQYAIEPGQRELRIEELDLTVVLDPDLSALENAQRLFKRYGKARDAAAVVPGLLQNAEEELAYLDQLSVHGALASDPASLAAVRDELRETSAGARDRPKAARKGQSRVPSKGGKPRPSVAPLRVRTRDGAEILVGRSARQNDAVTFSLATPQDVWFHARQIPGAHVIVRNNGRSPSNETLLQAAGLAAYYSQAREATTVSVDYTAVRNVRRIKGGKPGLVHYSGETTLNVRPVSMEAQEQA